MATTDGIGNMKRWTKTQLLNKCKELNIKEDKLDTLTNKELQNKIKQVINASKKQDNLIQLELGKENKTNEQSQIGKFFVREQDAQNKNIKYFECVDYKKDQQVYIFNYEKEVIQVPIEVVKDLFIEVEPPTIVEEKDIVNEQPQQDVKKNIITEEEQKALETIVTKNEIKVTKEKEQSEKQPYVGPGRGRITALIKCFTDPERTKLVKEFTTIADARNFLGVKAVGNSLERASETGKISRGYYWTLEEIDLPAPPTKKQLKQQNKNKKKEIKVEKQDTELIIVENPVQDLLIEDTIIEPIIKKQKDNKEDKEEDFDIFEGL